MIAETTIRVRYAETDQMGVAYYGNYLAWFEVGRVEWCKAAGFNYRDMEREDGTLLVVAAASCRYKAPARFDDELLIRTSIRKARSKLVTFAYAISNAATGELVATGETTHLVTDRSLRRRALPEKYRPMFAV